MLRLRWRRVERDDPEIISVVLLCGVCHSPRPNPWEACEYCGDLE